MKRASAILVGLMVIAVPSLALVSAQDAPDRPVATPALRGVWELVEYTLADGTRHPLAGRIFFSEREWQVLFFVIDADGEPRRGSAEGGEYEIEGERLVFHHGFHLSAGAAMEGLAESPLRMSATPGSEPEVARAVLDGDELSVHFPSGNRILFRRR